MDGGPRFLEKPGDGKIWVQREAHSVCNAYSSRLDLVHLQGPLH